MLPTGTFDIVEVRPTWDGVGEHTRFPIARLRYTKTTRLWAICWRDRNLKFDEYKHKRPTKNVQALLDYIENSGDPDLLGLRAYRPLRRPRRRLIAW